MHRYTGMPLYFLHIHIDYKTIDEECVELCDCNAAMARARPGAGLAAASVNAHGHLMLDHYISVTDKLGDVVGSVTFENVGVVEFEHGR